MVCQRTLVFSEHDPEQSSIFSDPDVVEKKIRGNLAGRLANLPIRIDIARHIHRPHTRGPCGGQNFLFDSARDEIRPLSAHDIYKRIPISQRICRIYAQSHEHRSELAAALDHLIGGHAEDDLTNM
jgi:hypothetical protein